MPVAFRLRLLHGTTVRLANIAPLRMARRSYLVHDFRLRNNDYTTAPCCVCMNNRKLTRKPPSVLRLIIVFLDQKTGDNTEYSCWCKLQRWRWHSANSHALLQSTFSLLSKRKRRLFSWGKIVHFAAGRSAATMLARQTGERTCVAPRNFPANSSADYHLEAARLRCANCGWCKLRQVNIDSFLSSSCGKSTRLI